MFYIRICSAKVHNHIVSVVNDYFLCSGYVTSSKSNNIEDTLKALPPKVRTYWETDNDYSRLLDEFAFQVDILIYLIFIIVSIDDVISKNIGFSKGNLEGKELSNSGICMTSYSANPLYIMPHEQPYLYTPFL